MPEQASALPRLPHYADRAWERYGYLPTPQHHRWYVDAIEGAATAPPEIRARPVDRRDPEREIWDVLVCGSPQRVVFCPRTRRLITFLPAVPRKHPKRGRRPSAAQLHGRASPRRGRPERREESEEAV